MPQKRHKYWYQAGYFAHNGGKYTHEEGGVPGESPLEALDFLYNDIEDDGAVHTITVYELKEGGELGEIVAQTSEKNQLKPKEKPKKVTETKSTESEYEHLDIIHATTSYIPRSYPTIGIGDKK